jgi:isopropylmalate/homocitrate/citramalate synthase
VSRDRDVWADFFIATSALRRHVEGWSAKDVLDRIERTSEALVRGDTPFGISIEDATRTSPGDLEKVVTTATNAGAQVLTICDTVGEATPLGAARLVAFVRDRAPSSVEVWWHGHDDRGLSLANAIAAAEAGASTISGAFLGLGERTGNTPLEQVVMFLHQVGHRGYRVDVLHAYCEALAHLTETPIRANAPIIGSQAFATRTGTHSAGLLKARALGWDFEDLLFSSVPAAALGRVQEIGIGPGSGTANARHVLRALAIEPSDENIATLLRHAKSSERWFTNGEVAALYVDVEVAT